MTSQRRPLFKRPAWVKASVAKDGDLFQRSIYAHHDEESLYSDEESDAIRPAKRAKSATGSQSKSRMESREEQAGSDKRLPHEGRLNLSDEKRNLMFQSQYGRNQVKVKDALGLSSTKNCDTGANEHVRTREHASESLSMASSDLITDASSNDAVKKTVDLDTEHDEEDFRELTDFTRARARRRQIEKDSLTKIENANIIGRHNGALGIGPTEMPLADDRTVQILVTSNIANTQPLIVTRKISQRLKEVKLAWIQHQQPQSQAFKDVFLTWRGNRLFDVLTCTSLLGQMGYQPYDLDSDGNGKLHLVAMTKDSFDRFRQDRDREQAFERTVDDVSSAELEQRKSKEAQFRIILQSRNFSDFKLMVKPSTSLSKILNAFRNSNNLDFDNQINIQFDGEHLMQSKTVGDYDLADMDHLEVYVK